MKYGRENIIASRWLRTLLLLTIVYFGQVSPFSHTHHSHDESALDFETSAHPVEVGVAGSSGHTHDEDSQSPNDHRHTYDKHIDWQILRTHNQTTLTSFDQYPLLSNFSPLTTDDNSFLIDHKKTPSIDNCHILSLIIRGPPISG